jgi:hypothetical protein
MVPFYGLVAAPSSKIPKKTKYFPIYSPRINPQDKQDYTIAFARQD